MKIFLTTDWHVGIYPLKLDSWMDMQKNYFYNFFIPIIESKFSPGDVVIHLGDLYDNRNNIDIKCMNMAEAIIKKISSIVDMHIIVGNHDLYNKSSNYVNSINLFNNIGNVYTYTHPTKINLGDKNVLMMPWIDDKQDQINTLKENLGCDYLFCHSDLNGCRMHLKSVANRNFNKLDISDFKGYDKVYSGHIHIVQRNNNFTFVGSPYQMDRNDIGDEKGVFIIDLETGEEEFIKNDYSPRFVKIKISDIGDISMLEKVDTSKNYVDISISNSLLINDRKVRRILERVLENGNFSKVDYINDVTVGADESINEDVSMDDVNFSDINFEDFENIILKFIDSKNYEDGNIKDGLLGEFDNVMRIYKDNYKFNTEEE